MSNGAMCDVEYVEDNDAASVAEKNKKAIEIAHVVTCLDFLTAIIGRM